MNNFLRKIGNKIRSLWAKLYPLPRIYSYLGNNIGLTRLHNGLPFFVHTRDRAISTWIILKGYWETHVDNILCNITKPGDIILDAGANQGYYSIKLAHIAGPSGKVVSFEPNPELFAILRSNVMINGFADRVECHQMALGAKPGKANMSFDYDNMGGGSLHALGHPQPLEVDVARGDDIISGVCKFDVMKFDIEGSEPLASEGLALTLANSSAAAIVVEVYPPGWAHQGDFGEILARFRSGAKLGFEIRSDGKLLSVNLDSPASITDMKDRRDSFYLLLIPADHWAMRFVRSQTIG